MVNKEITADNLDQSYYDRERTALDAARLESDIITGNAHHLRAKEVALCAVAYVLERLSEMDAIYMDRSSHDLASDKVVKVKAITQGCLEFLRMYDSTFRHYPLCEKAIKQIRSSVLYQDVFTITAIWDELVDKPYYEGVSDSIH